jgi:hypothetical protein
VFACFTLRGLAADDNDCRIRFNAWCSSGPIESYQWTIDTEGNAGGPYSKSGRVVVQQFGSRCVRQRIRVELTVMGSGGASSDTVYWSFRLPKADLAVLLRESGPITLAFTSHITAQESTAGFRGFVILNDTHSRGMRGSGPTEIHVKALDGQNNVEAISEQPVPGGFYWKFDFAGTQHLVPGSFRVEQGQISFIDAHTLVLRLNGSAGERIRFRFDSSR